MLYAKLIAVASPEAESNRKLPDRARAWRLFDSRFGLLGTFLRFQRIKTGKSRTKNPAW